MKKNVATGISFLLILFLISSKFVLGQNPGRDYKLMFSRDADGKIATMNAVGQKVFNFSIEGLANKQHADDFTKSLNNNPLVVYVNLIEPKDIGGQWKGVFVLEKKTKLPDFEKLLSDTGIAGIYVDGALVAIEDLEILKTNSINTPYKQN
ncbi:MAG TPA: hypothetical protein PKI01_01550 [Bacteroidales bacterium]|nr:hypothetical protein [Bacteroidales bacterium]